MSSVTTVFHARNVFGTFGAGKEQVVGGVHTEDRLGVALGHVHTLQPTGALAGLREGHRFDLTPARTKRKTHRANCYYNRV